MHQPGIEQRPLRMISGITTEFGQVLFDDARVAAENMIGEPGEGWRVAMTIVSHEREPGELGYVARYAKTVKELERTVQADPGRVPRRPARRGGLGPRADRDAAAPRVPAALGTPRRCRARSRRLHRQAADDVGRADRGRGRARGVRIARGRRRRRHRARRSTCTAERRVSWAAPRRSRRTSSRRASSVSPRADAANSTTKDLPVTYDLPDVVRVESDGPVRIVRLSRPEQLNAINDELAPRAHARCSRSSARTGTRVSR